MAQLEFIKQRLGIGETDTSKDMLLNQLLEDAKAEILDYCNRDTLLARMEGLQRELAIIYYNRFGDEGLTSRSEGPVSVSYNTEIPEIIKSRLNRYRRLKMVGVANEATE